MTDDPCLLDRLRSGVVTRSAAESQAVAGEMVRQLPACLTLALSGEVGAGKTTFTQGLARALGVKGPVTSPTFAIFNLHDGHDRRLVHLDAYRLSGPAALDALLIHDFLVPPYLLVCEWPENVLPALPDPVWWLHLERLEEGVHSLRLAETPA